MEQQTGLEISDVGAMNVLNLKESLKQRNLSYKGKKDELKQRLLDSIQIENRQSHHCTDNNVSRADFDTLISDFTDFKQHITTRLNKLQDNKEADKIADLHQQIKFLKEELQSKNQIINILQNDNDSLRNVAQKSENEHQKQVKENTNKQSTTTHRHQVQNNSTPSFNVQLSNRFDGLPNEPSFNTWNVHDNDNSFVRKKRYNNTKTKETHNRFVVQNPEQNSYDQRKETAGSGNVLHSRNRNFKNVLIVGDSIIRYMNRREMSNQLRCGKSYIKSFPGATVKQLEHYITPHLIERSPDAVIIHVGTNDIRPRDSRQMKSSNEIADSVISIAKKCMEYGVVDVFISGLTCRIIESDMKKVLETNSHLMNFCNSDEHLHFISNNNIQRENLWNDGIHLNDSGLNILTYNFFTSLNRNLI